jgi:simple sugar transport system substrate-binding protein
MSKKVWVFVAIAVLLGGLGGFLIGNNKSDTKSTETSGKRLKISVITHAAAGDTFWDIVRKGAEAAAKKSNVDLQFVSDPDGTRQAQLVQQAIDAKVDGIAVTLSKADAMKDVVVKAQKAGIPVVAINGGVDLAKELGITFIGQEDYNAGKAVGEKLKAMGVQNPICIIHEQGNVGLESRCQAIIDVLPNTKRLYVPGTDMTQTKSQITAELQTQTDADAIVGTGAPYTVVAQKVVAELGKTKQVTVASFDLSSDVTQEIIDGKVAFTVDQQPYLQGYQAVDALWLYKNGLFKLGGGEPVATGPAFITKDNAAAVLDYAKEGIR